MLSEASNLSKMRKKRCQALNQSINWVQIHRPNKMLEEMEAKILSPKKLDFDKISNKLQGGKRSQNINQCQNMFTCFHSYLEMNSLEMFACSSLIDEHLITKCTRNLAYLQMESFVMAF